MNRGCLHLKFLQNWPRVVNHRLVAQEAQCRAKFPPHRDSRIAQYRMQQNETFLLPVFAHITDTVGMKRVGSGVNIDHPPRYAHFAIRLFAHANDGLGEFTAASPDQTIEPENFTGPHGQRYAAMAR